MRNGSSTGVFSDALGVSPASGKVVIADAADQDFHVFDPATKSFNLYSAGATFPTHVAMDAQNQLAYVHDGYGTVNLLNLASGGYFPGILRPAATNCGPSSVSVGTDVSGKAYITTCDTTSGAVLHLFDGVGVGEFTAQRITLETPAQFNSFGFFSVSLGALVDPFTRAAFITNAASGNSGLPPNYGTVVVNGSTPTARPRLVISSTSATFGSPTAFLPTGTTQSQTITVTNNGTDSYAPLAAISQFRSSLLQPGISSFSITSDTCTNSNLAPSASCNVTVQFTSATYGQNNAALVFLDDSPDTPQVVLLTGYGRAPHVALQLLPTPANLPQGTVGFQYLTPAGLSVSFTSPNAQGGLSLSLCQTLPGGGPNLSACCVGNFSIPVCPTGLLPVFWDGSNSLIGFVQPGTVGSYPFSVAASDANGDSTTQDYVLVVNPAPTLTTFLFNPPSVEIGNSTTGIVTLSKAVPQTGAFVSLTGAPPILTVPVGAVVAPGQSTATFVITAPLTVPPGGSETVTASYGGTSISAILSLVPHTVTTVVPNVLNEPQALAQTVITDIGLTVGTITTQFSSTVATGSVISESPLQGTFAAPGVAVSLVISAGPAAPVADTENIKISDQVFITPTTAFSAPIASYSFSSLGFSSQGTQVLTISNIGQKNLTVTNVMLSGSAYSIGPVFCSNTSTTVVTTLLPGGACDVTISYASTSGTSSGTIQFMDNAALSNASNVGSSGNYTQTIPLSGSTSTSVPGAATLLTLSVSPNNQLLNPQDTLQFTARGTFSDGSVSNVTSLVIWSTSQPTVATISNAAGSQGLATAVNGGLTNITATLNLVSASTPLNVVLLIMEPIKINDAPNVNVPCQAVVSGSVSVKLKSVQPQPLTHKVAESITLTNISNTTISGPISLVIIGLGSNAALLNPSGTTAPGCPLAAGSPYVSVPGASLAPGGTASVSLVFADSNNGAITYNTRVTAGSGAP